MADPNTVIRQHRRRNSIKRKLDEYTCKKLRRFVKTREYALGMTNCCICQNMRPIRLMYKTPPPTNDTQYACTICMEQVNSGIIINTLNQSHYKVS